MPVLVEWITVCTEVDDEGTVIRHPGLMMTQPLTFPQGISVPVAVSVIGLNESMSIEELNWAVTDPHGERLVQYKAPFGWELMDGPTPEGLHVRRVMRIEVEVVVKEPGIHQILVWATGAQATRPWIVQLYVEGVDATGTETTSGAS